MTGPCVPERIRGAARSPRGRRDAAGLVAAVTALAYLWACRRVGARARTLGRPYVIHAGNIEIGDDVVIDSRAAPAELVCHRRGRLVIGHGTWIGPGARLEATGYVEIGDRACIGARCVISDALPDGAWSEGAEIWIGDGVTLGEGVRVLPGTIIGTGAVIAPGAIVSGRVPAGALADGGASAPAELADAGP